MSPPIREYLSLSGSSGSSSSGSSGCEAASGSAITFFQRHTRRELTAFQVGQVFYALTFICIAWRRRSGRFLAPVPAGLLALCCCFAVFQQQSVPAGLRAGGNDEATTRIMCASAFACRGAALAIGKMWLPRTLNNNRSTIANSKQLRLLQAAPTARSQPAPGDASPRSPLLAAPALPLPLAPAPPSAPAGGLAALWCRLLCVRLPLLVVLELGRSLLGVDLPLVRLLPRDLVQHSRHRFLQKQKHNERQASKERTRVRPAPPSTNTSVRRSLRRTTVHRTTTQPAVQSVREMRKASAGERATRATRVPDGRDRALSSSAAPPPDPTTGMNFRLAPLIFSCLSPSILRSNFPAEKATATATATRPTSSS